MRQLIFAFITVISLSSLPSRADIMPSPKVKPDKVPLALNWKPEPQFGGFYAAAATNGAALRNHVALEITPGGAGTPVVQMVAAGKFNFGIASADEVIIARSRGADVVAVFAAYQTNPQAIMTHEESGFKTLADVYAAKGTLAIQKGLPYALYLDKKYAKKNATIVPYLGGIQNFLADRTYSQQCFATSEPLAAKKANAKVKTFLVADEGFNPYTTVLIVRGDLLRSNQELVSRVVDTVRAGWRSYLAYPGVTNKTMSELNKSMDLETFEASAAAQKPLIEATTLGAMTEERWSTLRQQLVDLKLVKADALKSDVKDYFRNLNP